MREPWREGSNPVSFHREFFRPPRAGAPPRRPRTGTTATHLPRAARTTSSMRRALLGAALTLVLPVALHAQVSRGDSLLASGDTTGAIAAYEAAVMTSATDAEAH